MRPGHESGFDRAAGFDYHAGGMHRRIAALILAALPLGAEEPRVALDLTSTYEVPGGGDAPKTHHTVRLFMDSSSGNLTWTPADGLAREYSLAWVANHPGPVPQSSHLAWFLARSKDDFWILWAYLNDAGKSCWINFYHFAENTIPMTTFTGEYRYRPPAANSGSPGAVDASLDRVPAWKGPRFRLKEVNPEGGTWAKLRVLEKREWKDREGELFLKPLVHLDVPAKNGFDRDPWAEVHFLARSRDGARQFYVVTYTSVDHGWAVDLREGRLLKAHFGSPVEIEKR
jgi:hypothetical protein